MPADGLGGEISEPLETVELSGGVNQIQRVGNTVVRPAGVHTSTVHRLLRHLDGVGLAGIPTPVDLHPTHETLTFVPGETTNYPLASSFRTDSALTSAAELLRRLHDASASIRAAADDSWFRPSDVWFRPSEQRRRLHLFCDAYGTDKIDAVLRFAVSELRTLVGTMRRLAAVGKSAFARHIAEGHDQLYLADIDHISSNAATLAVMPLSDSEPS